MKLRIQDFARNHANMELGRLEGDVYVDRTHKSVNKKQVLPHLSENILQLLSYLKIGRFN